MHSILTVYIHELRYLCIVYQQELLLSEIKDDPLLDCTRSTWVDGASYYAYPLCIHSRIPHRPITISLFGVWYNCYVHKLLITLIIVNIINWITISGLTYNYGICSRTMLHPRSKTIDIVRRSIYSCAPDCTNLPSELLIGAYFN